MAKKTSSGAKGALDQNASGNNKSEEDIATPTDDSQRSADTPAENDISAESDGTAESTRSLYRADDAIESADAGDQTDDNKAIDADTETDGADASSSESRHGRDTSQSPEAGHELTDEDASTKTTEADVETHSTTTLPAPTPQPVKGPGAGSMILGGVVAGAIGFAAAYFGVAQQVVPRDEVLIGDVGDLSQRLEEQAGTIEALSEKVGGITNTDDSALQAQIEALGTLSERVAETEQQIEDLSSRVGGVEQRPVSENADEAAIAAYENELNAVREEFAAQRAELEDLINQAMNTETAADEAAVAAMQRAAISRIQAALDNGTGFAGAVAELQDTDIEVPDALTSVSESGVATLSSLQESFPDAARAALDASRDVAGGGTGLKGFLKSQLGARSLEPREGDDPDAVLSRAEAAVRDGRLQDALAEIEALPEEGRAELSDWSGRAAERLEAVGAAQSLSETLN